MESVIVKPSSKKDELIFVTVATVLILVIASVSIALRSDKVKPGSLKSYQINAFSGLNTKEQFVFTSLYAAGFEIESYHITNGETWPSVKTLEGEGLSPFVKDRLWKDNGRIRWTDKLLGEDLFHQMAYLGRPQTFDIEGRFLLILDHLHDLGGTYLKSSDKAEPFRIWYTNKLAGGFPRDLSAGNLIKEGWKEVIPYKGKDEAKKLGRG